VGFPANNDSAQLDRGRDSIVDASMYPEQLQDAKHGVLTTGRSRSTGQVVFQRGFQLPQLPPGSGLMLPRTRSVHTHFMRFPIDVVFLDSELRIVSIVNALRPWRLAAAKTASAVLELASGGIRTIHEAQRAYVAEPPSPRTFGR